MFRGRWMVALSGMIAAAAVTQSARGQLIVGRGNDANEVYHVDVGNAATTPLFNLAANGITIGNGVEGLDVDDAGRSIYIITGATSIEALYRAHYEDHEPADPTRLRVRKVTDLQVGAAKPRPSGLAFSSTNGKLYASTESSVTGAPEGIYEINIVTGEMTNVMDFSAQSTISLSGLAHNPTNNLLYATNNQTGPTNLLLNTIDLTQPPATARTTIAGTTLTTSDEGLTIANDRAYVLNSGAGPVIKVYTLAPVALENTLNLSGWTGTDNAAGAGWAPNLFVPPAGSNLGVKLTASQSNAAELDVGTPHNYTVHFNNFGPSTATNVAYSIVLSGSATVAISNIVSTSGSAAEGPTGTITGSIPSMGVNSLETLTFTAIASTSGTLTATASIPQGGNSDPYLPNNSEALSHAFAEFHNVNLVFSAVTASPSSLIPGLGSVRIESSTSNGDERIRKPVASPKGNYVSFRADTDAATSQDIMFLRRDPGNTWSVVVQEGVTPLTPGDFIAGEAFTGRRLALLDDGRFGYSIDTNASSLDEMTILYDNTSHTVVAREGSFIPVVAGLGIGYGSTQDSTSLTGDGRFAIRMSSMTGAGTSPNNTGIVSDSGNILVTRGGSSIPGNQLGGGTLAVATLSGDDFWMDCTGSNYMYAGTLTGSVDVIVVNGDVVFQEGGSVSGFTGTLPATWSPTGSGINYAQMYANGEWWCRGTTSDTTQDFVLKGFGGSYTTVAKRGDPLFTGSGETWSDVDGFGPTFFGFAANRQGSYVLVGRSNIADVSKNAVAVANGTTEILREGDRVDLDGNGFPDDDAFIERWVVDMQLLTDQGDYYSVVNLRNAAGDFLGKALVHVPNVGGPPLTGADVTVTKTVSDNFLDAIGQQTVFTVQVCNRGPADATNVVMTDAIPAGLDFVSATNGAVETAPNSNIVTATAASLPGCTCQSYDITVQSVSAGVFNNTASATGAGSDPNPANNSDSVSVEVIATADVSVTKIDNGGSPPGGQFTYTITITNNGPDTATNVLMTDTLDASTTFVSATNGATQSSPGVVTRTFASITNGASEVVQITVTAPGAPAFVTNQVTVSATEADPNNSNNTAIRETPVSNDADVAIAIPDPGLQRTGQDYSYTLTISNNGPAPATNVQVTATLPAGLNFVSATNGAVENPAGSGNVQATFANLASQTSQVIVLTVNAPAPGIYTLNATVTATQSDGDDLNNAAQVITRVGNFNKIRPIYTRILGHPTALVPGLLDGADQPLAGDFDLMSSINVSPDGSRWVMIGSANVATAIDGVYMLGSGFTGAVFAQEGKPAFGTPSGNLFDGFFDTVGFNSNNDFAWSASATGAEFDDITYTNIGGVNTIIAKDGDTVNGMVDPSGAGNETLANSSTSDHLLDDGRVGFYASNLDGITGDFEPVLVYWDNVSGINAFRQGGVATLGADTITDFPSLVGRVFQTTPDGAHTLYVANATTTVDILAVDDVPILRTGDVIPATAITVSDVFQAHLAPNGSWIARGDDLADDDWVVRNGALVAATGQSVEGGAELWGNSIGNISVNNSADFLITGNTNNPDTNLDSVMVLNGEVIVRESDPVDLDNNGILDDGVFINAFTAFNAFVSQNRQVHFLATLKTAEGTNLNTAFLVVDVGACATVLGDANGSSSRNGRDVQSFVNCLFLGDLTHPCKCADMDNDGDIDPADATLFATALVGDP